MKRVVLITLALTCGVALVGMVTGIRDGVTALYEMTDAGKAAKASSEAMTKAIGKLESLANATNVSRDVFFSLIAAQAAQGEAGARLREIAAEIQEVQAEYAIQLRDLAIYQEEARQNAYGYSEQAFVTEYEVHKLAKRLTELNAEFDQQKAIFSGASQQIKSATAERRRHGGG